MGFYQTDQVRQNPTDEAKANGKGKWWRWRYVKKIFFSLQTLVRFCLYLFSKRNHTQTKDCTLILKGIFYFICFSLQTLVRFLLVLIIKKKSYADHRLPLNSKAYFLIFSFSDCKLWSGFCWYFKTKKSYTDHSLHLNSKHIYLKLS